jgi:hypothetical protein
MNNDFSLTRKHFEEQFNLENKPKEQKKDVVSKAAEEILEKEKELEKEAKPLEREIKVKDFGSQKNSILLHDLLCPEIDNLDKQRKGEIKHFLEENVGKIDYESLIYLKRKDPSVHQKVLQINHLYYQWSHAKNPDKVDKLKNKIAACHEDLRALVEQGSPRSPITRRALQQQIRLMQSIREAKKTVAKNETLEKLEGSQNEVFPVRKKSSIETEHKEEPIGEDREKLKEKNTEESAEKEEPVGEIFGYYKEGKGGKEDSGKMEKLMYEFAVVAGLEHSFAPTGLVELVEDRRGSYQPAIEGQRLDQCLSQEEQPDFPHEHVIEGTLTSVLFGTADVTPQNLFYQKAKGKNKGGFIFYDNTRSMVSSNEVIKKRLNLYPPYRSALLGLVESYESLSKEELATLKEQIADYKKKAIAIEKYINLPSTKTKLSALPPGWWGTASEEVKAMHERLNRMEKAVDQGEVDNLRDLVFAAFPEMKFFMALEMMSYETDTPELSLMQTMPTSLTRADVNDLERLSAMSLGSLPIEQLIYQCGIYGFDVGKIEQMCQEKIPFDRIVLRLRDYAEEVSKQSETEEQKELREASNLGVYEKLEAKAKIDFKDVPREEAVALFQAA